MTLTWFERSVEFREEVPPKDHWLHECRDYPYSQSHVVPVNPKAETGGTSLQDFGPVDGFSLGAELFEVEGEGRMGVEESLADTADCAARIAQGSVLPPLDVDVELCFPFGFLLLSRDVRWGWVDLLCPRLGFSLGAGRRRGGLWISLRGAGVIFSRRLPRSATVS